MSRCCGGTSITALQEGSHVEITGLGTSQDPYVISADVALDDSDNAVFDVTITGAA